MRNAVNAPRNRITQGTIFFGVKSPYEHCLTCYGISITARCDTAHNFKAPSLTFLPVVSMEEWLWYDILPRCIEEQIKSSISGLRSHLIDKLGTSIVLDAFGVEVGFSSIDISNKGIKKHHDNYREALGSQKLSAFEWDNLPKSIINKLSSEAKELLKGKNQNYYFIESVECSFGTGSQNPKCGFVVILRDIRTISRDLALEVMTGIDQERLNLLATHNPTAYQLFIDDDGFCYPTGELTSPFIEQLMQSFSLLFGRIGTKDVPELYVNEILKLLGSK